MIERTRLEVIRLRTGEFVKPVNTCGTCGWYPKAWQIAPVSRGDTPIRAFLIFNRNWTRDELIA